MDNMDNPFLKAPNGKKMVTLIGIYLGFIGSVFVSSGLSTLLPAAALEIGGVEIYPLASTFAGLIMVVGMPLYGYLGAKRPEVKRLLVVLSLTVGAGVMLLRGIAPTMEFIIVVSFFYGLVSTGLLVIGFSIIRDMFEIERAGTLLGMVGSVMAFGQLLGPILMGFIIDRFSWRAACFVVCPVFLIGACMILSGVKATREEAAPMVSFSVKKFDLAGGIALTVFLCGLVLALSFGPSSSNSAVRLPFGSAGNNALITAAVIGLVVLIAILRKKGDEAVLPARVLKDRNTLCLACVNLFCSVSMMAVFFFIPAYVMYVMQRTAVEAGLAATALSILGLFLSPIFGRMIAKARNARNVLIAGTLVRIGITLCFVLFLTPTVSIWVVYIMMFIAGFYNSQHNAVISTGPQIQVQSEIRVMSNSVIQLAQIVGSATGLAVDTMVIGVYGVADGMPIAFIIAVVFAAVALIFGFFLRPLQES
jgi:MFS family permease